MKGKELAHSICELLADKKGEDIVCFDATGYSDMLDYFIIATGSVDTHVRALGSYLIEELKKNGVQALAKEGFDTGVWVCVDYGDVIVHIMREQERKFYHLESIWGACPKETFED